MKNIHPLHTTILLPACSGIRIKQPNIGSESGQQITPTITYYSIGQPTVTSSNLLSLRNPNAPGAPQNTTPANFAAATVLASGGVEASISEIGLLDGNKELKEEEGDNIKSGPRLSVVQSQEQIIQADKQTSKATGHIASVTGLAALCPPLTTAVLYPLIFQLTRSLDMLSTNLAILTLNYRPFGSSVGAAGGKGSGKGRLTFSPQAIAAANGLTPLTWQGNDEQLIINGYGHAFHILSETVDSVISPLSFHKASAERIKMKREQFTKSTQGSSVGKIEMAKSMSRSNSLVQKKMPTVNTESGILASIQSPRSSVYVKEQNPDVHLDDNLFWTQGSDGNSALTFTPLPSIHEAASFFSQFCAHHQTIASLKNGILGLHHALQLAQDEHDRVDQAIKKQIPHASLPADALTFLD
ncbi:MAG: hypothetical protein EZS28_047118, partial [Streblomastix strix]